MTTTEVAGQVNARGRYVKKDGSDVTAFQIHGRTPNYPHLFKRDGAIVALRYPTLSASAAFAHVQDLP
jgi:hypothetical protein